MRDLSTSMKAALVAISRKKKAWVGAAYPGHKFTLYDHHGIDLQGRSLEALWKRGLVAFEVHVRLTCDGKEAIQDDIRTRPGERNFRVVE
jgi:hypothetical protein